MIENLKHIRESGLLELYALGDLSPSDKSKVEDALKRYPELRKDLQEIETALYTYAEANAIEAPKSVLDNVLAEINSQKTYHQSVNSSTGFNMLNKLLGLTLIACLAFLAFKFIENKNLGEEHSHELALIKEKCNQDQQILKDQLTIYRALDDQNNKRIPIQATDKYPQTQIVFNTNQSTKKNILQLRSLPQINANQSFQLWSLKGDNKPIPLNVFNDVDQPLEVDFVEGTDAYAITIEPKGGQNTPTLDNLIGIFNVAG